MWNTIKEFGHERWDLYLKIVQDTTDWAAKEKSLNAAPFQSASVLPFSRRLTQEAFQMVLEWAADCVEKKLESLDNARSRERWRTEFDKIINSIIRTYTFIGAFVDIDQNDESEVQDILKNYFSLSTKQLTSRQLELISKYQNLQRDLNSQMRTSSVIKRHKFTNY